MAGEIASILLVPSVEHREALLGDGPCGSRVPTMHQWREGERGWSVGGFLNPVWKSYECALVLAHDGKAVPEGCDRAARSITAWTLAKPVPKVFRSYSPQGTYSLGLTAGHPVYAQPYTVMDLARAWEVEGARIVLLDRDGREVSDG